MEEGVRSSSSVCPVVLSFFIGGLVGAGVGLLLAPQAGRETRRRIKEFVENSEEKAKTSIGEIKGKVNSALEKGEDILQEKKSVLTTAVEAGKEAYQKEKKKLVKESPGEDH